jgi:glycosyltransferase involved in cell wall biosynthesis
MDLVFQDASCFDIIHFHCDYLHFPLLRRNPCPSVTTLHGRLHVPDLQALFAEFAEVPLVSISHDQQRPIPWASWQATVYHGLPRNLHTFHGGQGDYLAFLGRISPEKRLDRAIAFACQAGKRLKVLGLEINGPQAQIYFIRPHLPVSLGELRMHHLAVAVATVDLLLVRHEQDVGDGDVQILVVK